MLLENLTSAQFNFLEGCFWVLLGLVSSWVCGRVSNEYKKLGYFSAFVLITFGISDFVQVLYGSFLQPHLWWLFAWKVISVIGLVAIVVWYLILRLAKTDTSAIVSDTRN
jgi:hypothetical protein